MAESSKSNKKKSKKDLLEANANESAKLRARLQELKEERVKLEKSN